MTLFGYTFELPEWVVAIRDGIKAAYNTARGYLSGEVKFSSFLNENAFKEYRFFTAMFSETRQLRILALVNWR